MPASQKTTPLARALRGPAEILDAVDLAWYDRGKMVFLWQLDWTARLYRSLVAIGEQIPDDDRVFRFLAIPLGEGDLGRVHGVNERVGVKDYATSVNFFARLLRGVGKL